MILIVEDDDDIREELAALLRSRGYDIVTAEHGLAARDWLRGARTLPKMILLDLMMPVMDGWQLRAELLQDSSLANIPVLVVSGVGDVRTQARALGATAYLEKPFNVDSLLDVLHRALVSP